MFAPLNRLMAVLALCIPLVQPAQASPVDSLAVAAEAVDSLRVAADRVGSNIHPAKKFTAGVLGGVGGGLLGGALGLGLGQSKAESGTDPHPLNRTGFFVLGFWIGNAVGTAAGVSRIDPQGNFLTTLAGSAALGIGVPMICNATDMGGLTFFSALFGPIIGATIGSELWRKPLSAELKSKPESRRISVGLVPQLQRGLSAVAMLRF